MNLEQAEWKNESSESDPSLLSNSVQDLLAGFRFDKTDQKLPAGFASAEDLLGDARDTKGMEDEIARFAKEEAADGGLAISADYLRQLQRDLSRPELKSAISELTHERAKEIWEEMRQADAEGTAKTAEINDGRLTESELRGAYRNSSMEERAAILYALSDFKTFAKAGNYLGADWTMTAIDKDDIYYAKEREE